MVSTNAGGDPRVLLAMNAVLSSLFVALVLYLSEFAGITEFTPERFVVLTALLIVLTYFVTR